MPLSFPSSPSVNDQHTTGGRVYQWTGEAWQLVGSGIPGATGATGPVGPAGSGIALKGSVAAVENLPGSGNTAGDSYVVTANGNLYVWSGSAWQNVGQIVGPTGAQGSTGPQGQAGAASTVTGPTGPAGAAGQAGAASTVTGPTGPASTVTGPTGPTGGGGSFTWASVPTGSSATGTAGDIAYDSSYLYVRTSTLWKRTALSTWGGDADFANVVLLMHFDGSGATFTDSSIDARTVTAYGDATQSATESKFGGKALYCDGTGDYVAVPSSADFDWSTGDCVIEGWIRVSDLSKTRHLCGTSTSNSDGKTGVYVTTGGALAIGKIGVGELATAGSKIAVNTWYHIAVVKHGSSAYIYIGGTREASGNASDAWSSGSAAFQIGRTYQTGNGDGDWQGYVDDLRVTVGANRGYTGSTITVPTAAYLDY